MVVHADVVGRGVVGLRVEVTQAHHTEVARQVHFALALEGQRARAIVRAKACFQLETSLQAVAQVFHTFETDARVVVFHRSFGQIARFLMFDGGVHATINGHAALGHDSRGTADGHSGQHQAREFHHVKSLWEE